MPDEPSRGAGEEPTELAPPVRSPPGTWALRGLFLMALLVALDAGFALLFPIVLALLLSLLLRPLVSLAERVRLPRPLGAALVLGALLGLLGAGIAYLREPATEWLAEAPRSLERVESKLQRLRGRVEEASRAAEQVEEITQVGERESRQKVEIQEPGLLETVIDALPVVLGGAVVTVILVYLFLVFDELILRRVVQILPRLGDKRRAVQIARDIERQVSRYLLTITAINAVLAAAVGAVLHLTGVPNPFLWGILAGLLNFVPYVGAVVGVSIVAVVALVSIDGVGQALLGPAIYALINTLEGMLLTPLVLGQRFSLNPLVIFVWLLLWGWLWGMGGALIAIPLLTAVKIFCDRIPPLSPVGHFLER